MARVVGVCFSSIYVFKNSLIDLILLGFPCSVQRG